MSGFQTHFRFYENGAPYPGTCVFSGDNKNLWEVGSLVVQGQALPILLSDRVLCELAEYTGYVRKEVHEELNDRLSKTIETQSAQLDAAPTLIKELTNGINNLLSDFIGDLASVASVNKPIQSQGYQADTRSPEELAGPAAQAGQAKGSSTKPSTKSASK